MKLTNTQILILGGLLLIACIVFGATAGVVATLLMSSNNTSLVSTSVEVPSTSLTPQSQNAQSSETVTQLPSQPTNTPTSAPIPLPTPTIDSPCAPEKLQEYAMEAESYRSATGDAFERFVENMGKRPETINLIHQGISDIYLEVQRLTPPNCAEATALRTELLKEIGFLVDATSDPVAMVSISTEEFQVQLEKTNRAFENLKRRAGLN